MGRRAGLQARVRGTGTTVALLQLVICLLLAGVQGQTCDPQCVQAQQAALSRLYGALDGARWRSAAGWRAAAAPLCERHGVSCGAGGGLVSLELPVNGLAGSIPGDALAALAPTLESLDLFGNAVTGSLPQELGSLLRLRSLRVGSNKLEGTLPAGLGQLPALERLEFAHNAITGAIPAGLANSTTLRVLRGAGNRIDALPDALLAAPSLDLLDLSRNALAGMAPLANGAAGTGARRPITELSLRGNALAGPIPPALAALPVVVLDLGDNQLEGALPAQQLAANTALREVAFDGNRLTGALPERLIGPNLKVFDASKNALEGPLPASLGSPADLQALRLARNKLTGRLPDGFASSMESLADLDLSSNQLEPGDALPPWLALDRAAPLRVTSAGGGARALCAPLALNLTGGPTEGTVLLDPSYYGWQGCECESGFQASLRPLPGGGRDLTCRHRDTGLLLAAILTPLLAAAAIIGVGLVLARKRVWGAMAWAHRPVAPKREPPGLATKQVTLVLTDVQGSTELWEWDTEVASEAFSLHDSILRAYMNRFFGYEVSTEGDAFLVAFHEPFDAVAWCLAVQIALHYAPWPERLLRHKNAAPETADSLQKKRAMRRRRWHEKLADTSAAAAAAEGAGSGSGMAGATAPAGDRSATSPREHAAAVQEMEGSIGSLTDSGPMEPDAASVEGDEDDEGPPDGGLNSLFRGLRVRMSLATGRADDVRVHSVTQRHEYGGHVLRRVQAVAETPHGGQVIMDPDTFQGVHARLPELGGCVLEAAQKALRAAGLDANLADVMQASGLGPQDLAGWRPSLDPNCSLDLGSRPLDLRNPDGSSRTIDARFAESGPGAPETLMSNSALFASVGSTVESPADARNSIGTDDEDNSRRASGSFALWDNQRGTAGSEGDVEAGGADAASGGAPAGGQQGQMQGQQRGPRLRLPRPWGRPQSPSRFANAPTPDPAAAVGAATAAHGEDLRARAASRGAGVPAAVPEAESYEPSFGDDTPRSAFLPRPSLLAGLLRGGTARPRAPRALRSPAGGGRSGGGSGASRRRSRRRSSLSYSVMVIDMGVHELSNLSAPMNLVQVMPCGLEDRARFFPRLDSLRQKTPGFFDAPAAGLVPLGAERGPAAQPESGAFPETTVVFCTIDKYADMLLQSQKVAEEALVMYSDAVRWLLLVAGGYECQEAEGTFMVAFASADAAIEWCLMCQRVLRDMNWPERVLSLRASEVERDVHGRVVFRGPRVKMGVYSGVPTRVVPHTTTGRADYFGQLVNRAARYCHAAARGGQVLVSRELMVRVLSSWMHSTPSAITSDCLLEMKVQFDASQLRTWPWAFMRRDSVGVYVTPTDAPPGIPLRLGSTGSIGAGSGDALSGAGSGGSGRRPSGPSQQQPLGQGQGQQQQQQQQQTGQQQVQGQQQPQQQGQPQQEKRHHHLLHHHQHGHLRGEPGSAAEQGPAPGSPSARVAVAAAAAERRDAADGPQASGGNGSGARNASDANVLQWRQAAAAAAAEGGGGGSGGSQFVGGEEGGEAVAQGRDSDQGVPHTPAAGAAAAGTQWPTVPLPPTAPRMPAGMLPLPPPPRARRPSLLMTLREGSEHLDGAQETGPAAAADLRDSGASLAAAGTPPVDVLPDTGVAAPAAVGQSVRRASASDSVGGAGAGGVGVGGGGRQRRSSARSDGAGAAARRAALLEELGLPDSVPDAELYAAAAAASYGSGGAGSRRASGLGLPLTEDDRRSSAGPSVGASIGSSALYGSGGAPGGSNPRRNSRLLGSYMLADEGEANAYMQASLALLPGGGPGTGPAGSSGSGPSMRHGGQSGPAPGSGSGDPQAAAAAAALGQGLAPGSLHSSSRLRLVSKRRRQMSYCYDFESSHPGIPAEVADATVPGFGSPLVTAASGGTARRGVSATSSVGVSSLDHAVGGAAADAPAASGVALLPPAPQSQVPPAAPSSGAAVGRSTPIDVSVAGRSSRRDSGTANSAATTAEELLHAARLRALPAVSSLPDAGMLQSLRPLQRRTRTPSARTDDSASCFGGAAIETTCAAVMQHRWLWVRELLVHDLGQFQFKGVAGTHAIVSVTCEELAGRTFPNTIRRGKGEQVAMGRGLLYVVAIDPVRPLHVQQLQHLQQQLQQQRHHLPRSRRSAGDPGGSGSGGARGSREDTEGSGGDGGAGGGRELTPFARAAAAGGDGSGRGYGGDAAGT